jgi:hypothetical protein
MQDPTTANASSATPRSRSTSSARRRALLEWGGACTVATEVITLYLRFRHGATAVEFNRTAPLLLQIHHLFWSIPAFMVAVAVWKRPKLSGALAGIAVGFIVSDLLHHFVALPLTVGNTGWHWP